MRASQCNTALYNGIWGSQKFGKGVVGGLTYLHNLCVGDSGESPCLFPINPIPQLTGTFKRNNLHGCQHHGITGSRVPAVTFILFLYIEFTGVAF